MKPFFALFFLLITIGTFSQNENAVYHGFQLEQQYKILIEAADKLMVENDYTQAEVKYYEALKFNYGESAERKAVGGDWKIFRE